MKNIVKRFNNIAQFYSYLENGKTQDAFKGDESSMEKDDYKFEDCKTRTYDEANKLMLYGDKELAKKIDAQGLAKVRKDAFRTTSMRRQVYSSVVGFAPNVPAYLAGSPASMIAIKQEKLKERVINIHYNVATSWMVKSDDIVKVASNLLSAICKIEAAGVRINLTCGFAVHNSRDTQQTTSVVKIKDSREKLDLLKVAYPMVHPSMQRRHNFRFLEVTEGIAKDFADGYGRQMESKDVKKMLLDAGCKVNVVVRFNDLVDLDSDGVVKYIEKELKEGAK